MAFNKAKVLQEAENLASQGKISQAIKRYFNIFENDPSELILLNTIGDLYIRDRNVSEGLKQFYRLAEAYVLDGYTLKAIAIYKKIVKLEPDAVDPLLKLIELYQAQKLGREARELYYQVAECYRKKKQNDKALETLRKVVQLDVANATARARLAAFCEEIGRKDEAAQVHLETAQLALRRGDTGAAQIALQKAQELNPDDPQIQLLKAREALLLNHPEEVEALLSATPGLKDDPAGRSLLMESYVAMQQPEKAETLALNLLRANPSDFSPLASFVSVCVERGQFDAASKALSVATDELIEQGNTRSLMESLRLVQSKCPQHLPTLELIFRICEESGNGEALAEILEGLGHAYLLCGQYEKARQTFQRLLDREPANEHYKLMLRDVFQKQGEKLGKAYLADLPSSVAELTQEEEVTPPAASALRVPDRETTVKEALENSELFARYHLVSKAVAELERVLEIYPDETEIHRRLVGMCWKDMPERAEQAAQALARIYTQQGDAEGARRFAQMAGEREAAATVAVPPQAVHAQSLSPEPSPPLQANPAATTARETDLASEFSLTTVQEAQGTPLDPSISPGPKAPPPAALESPLDFTMLGPPPPPTAPPSEIEEIDLSGDWESFLAQPATLTPSPKAPQQAVSFNYDDSRVEINFYLEHGFFEEAKGAVGELERTLPNDPRIAALRALVEAHVGTLAEEVPARQPAVAREPTPSEAAASLAEEVVEQREQASSGSALKPEGQPAAPLISPGEEEIPAEATPGVSGEASANRLGDFAEAFEPGIGRLEERPHHPSAPSEPAAGSAAGFATPSPPPASALSGLLEETGDRPGTEPVQEGDSEAHYNLGVAYWEMNHPDEAIGELQKVVKGAGKEDPNYLQACTLLAACFMDKGMAPIAVNWYCRALETPDLDEEAWLALQYDLGVAYERAGDLPRALERFSEVYSRDIDFRDVAEKIRTFQQKGS